MKIRTLFAYPLFLLAVVGNAYAITYNLPETSGDRVVASSEDDTASITVDHDQTLLDVARRFNLGQTEIVTLNPKLDRWLIKKVPLYVYPIDVFYLIPLIKVLP